MPMAVSNHYNQNECTQATLTMKSMKPVNTSSTRTAIAAALAALSAPVSAQLVLEEVIVTAEKSSFKPINESAIVSSQITPKEEIQIGADVLIVAVLNMNYL